MLVTAILLRLSGPGDWTSSLKLKTLMLGQRYRS